jgi:hypothetical protein
MIAGVAAELLADLLEAMLRVDLVRAGANCAVLSA